MNPANSSVDHAGIESDPTHRLFRILCRKKACDFDELLEKCPSYIWKQAFLEIDVAALDVIIALRTLNEPSRLT